MDNKDIPIEPPIEYIPIWVPPKEKKKISMTISTFNRPKLLQKAVESVLKQTCQDFHLYIIDNNSLPEVKKVLDQWIGNPHITIYTTTMTEKWRSYYWGCEVCHKKAWEIGDEPYIATISDDCEMYPNKLQVLSEYLDTHPDIKIVHGEQVAFNSSGAIMFTRNGKNIELNGAHKMDGNQIMYRRSLLKETYPEILHWNCRKCDGNPDAKFFERLTELGIPMYPVDVLTEKFLMHKFHAEIELDSDLRE